MPAGTTRRARSLETEVGAGAGSSGDYSMSKPLVASVSHELGRREAKQRIESGLGEIRSHLSTFTTSIEEKWTEDRLDFRLIAFGQVVSGNINVFEDLIRIEVVMPAMLSILRGRISSRIREHGIKLLGTK
jgi:hypothetical protein